MAIPRPTQDSRSVQDVDGALLDSWERGLRWRALPSAVAAAVRFTARAAPGTVALAIGNGVLAAVSVAAVYLLLQRLVPRLAEVSSLQDVLSGPSGTLALAGLLLLLVRTLTAALDEYLQWLLQQKAFAYADFSIMRAALRVDLQRYEDPEFFALLQRCSPPNRSTVVAAASSRLASSPALPGSPSTRSAPSATSAASDPAAAASSSGSRAVIVTAAPLASSSAAMA